MIYIYLYFFSLMLLMYMFKYMLILLMMIEFLVISAALIILVVWGKYNLDFYMIYYLVFSVCEGVLGLGVLLMIVRFSGSDLYYMFNISKF